MYFLLKSTGDTTDLPKRSVLEQKVPIIVGIQFDDQPLVSNSNILTSCPIKILGIQILLISYRK